MTYRIVVNCQDEYGRRSYAKYVGYTMEQVVKLSKALPEGWTVTIEKI